MDDDDDDDDNHHHRSKHSRCVFFLSDDGSEEEGTRTSWSSSSSTTIVLKTKSMGKRRRDGTPGVVRPERIERFLATRAEKKRAFEDVVRGWHEKGDETRGSDKDDDANRRHERSAEAAARQMLEELFSATEEKEKMVEVQKNSGTTFPGSTYERRSKWMNIREFLRLDVVDACCLGGERESYYLAQEDVPEAMANHLDSFTPYAKGLARYVKDKEYKRRVWMNKERVETTPHYDDYDNVLFVWTGRKTVHLKEFGTGGFLFGVANTEVANHAHPTHLPDLKSYEYTFDVKAGEAVFIPMGWIHRVESDEGTIAITHEIRGKEIKIPSAENEDGLCALKDDVYLIRKAIERQIELEFKMLVSELVEANNEESKKKTKVNQDNVAHIKRKKREGEGEDVNFEIDNPEQFMETISQSCATLLGEIDEEEEKGMERTNHSGNKIPKYRKCVLAMNPLQSKLHLFKLSLLRDHLGNEKYEKWYSDCCLKYIETRGPDWKREDTCASILCEKREGYDFKRACVAVVKLARRKKKYDEETSSLLDVYASLNREYTLIGGWPRENIKRTFDPHAAFGLI